MRLASMTCVQNVHETGFVDLWLITHNTTKVNLYKWYCTYINTYTYIQIYVDKVIYIRTRIHFIGY